MEICDLDPCVRYANLRTVSVSCPENVIAYDFRLFYLIGGSCRLCYHGNFHSLTAGNLVIFPPGHPYRLELSQGAQRIVVNFDLTFERANAPIRRSGP